MFSLCSDVKVPPKYFHSHGLLQNTNTIEKFKDCDKKKLLEDAGKEVCTQNTSISSNTFFCLYIPLYRMLQMSIGMKYYIFACIKLLKKSEYSVVYDVTDIRLNEICDVCPKIVCIINHFANGIFSSEFWNDVH